MGKIFDELSPRYMTDLIRDFRLLDFQAAGIVGNGGHESGGFEQLQELNPTAGRGGLGHFQWTGPRRVSFEAWLARHPGWTAATYEANYSMLFRELIGPEQPSIMAVKAAANVGEATKVFCEKFERPGVISLESRLKWANRALEIYRKSGPVKAPEPPQATKPASTWRQIAMFSFDVILGIVKMIAKNPTFQKAAIGMVTNLAQKILDNVDNPNAVKAIATEMKEGAPAIIGAVVKGTEAEGLVDPSIIHRKPGESPGGPG